jgi:hypothetical protein
MIQPANDMFSEPATLKVSISAQTLLTRQRTLQNADVVRGVMTA